MLCDICKKNNAVIRIQKIKDGKTVIVNLCADCAEKHKTHEHFEFGDIEIGDILDNIKKITKNLNLQNLIFTADELDKNINTNSNNEPVLRCPKCGFSLNDIDQNSGLLGCSECYKTFEKEVMESIENIQRCKIHVGKHPSNSKKISKSLIAEKIIKLENDLQEAIQSEQYEQAALLRDEINLLKKNQAQKSDE